MKREISLSEALIVIAIALGLIIIGRETYAMLPQETQSDFSAAVSFLDLRDEWQRPVETASFLLDAQKEFMDQFYLAFTQVLTVEPENLPKINLAALKEGFYLAADAVRDRYNQVAVGESSAIASKTGIAESLTAGLAIPQEVFTKFALKIKNSFKQNGEVAGSAVGQENRQQSQPQPQSQNDDSINIIINIDSLNIK